MINSILLNVISRILAVAFVSTPLAFLAFASDEETKRIAVDMSRQDLYELVTSTPVSSVGETFLMIFVLGTFFVGVVEVTAFGFRALFKQLSRKPIA